MPALHCITPGLLPLLRIFVAPLLSHAQPLAGSGRCGMKFTMLLFGESYQIVRRIVGRVAVYVVHVFITLQSAAVRLFPNQTMFRDITRTVGQRMTWKVHKPIAQGILRPPALPPMGTLTSLIVAMSVTQWVAVVLPSAGVRGIRNLRAFTASTFAPAGRRHPIGGRLPAHAPLSLSELLRTQLMRGQEPGWCVRMMALRRDFLAATTMANQHRLKVPNGQPRLNQRMAFA